MSKTLGYCPQCHGEVARREKCPNGKDTCVNGHVYPMKNTLQSTNMDTSTATIRDINAVTKRLTVETDKGDTYLVEVKWFQLNSFLVGMRVKVKYVDGDQFATIVAYTNE